MVHSAKDESWEGSLHLIPSLSPSCNEITTHAVASARGRASGREVEDYWQNMKLTTTRVKVTANICAVNRLPTSLFESPSFFFGCYAAHN